MHSKQFLIFPASYLIKRKINLLNQRVIKNNPFVVEEPIHICLPERNKYKLGPERRKKNTTKNSS